MARGVLKSGPPRSSGNFEEKKQKEWNWNCSNNVFPPFQNYTIKNLQKHTKYTVALAAKNFKGLGPNATIELKTVDGGKK